MPYIEHLFEYAHEKTLHVNRVMSDVICHRYPVR